jgi:hypothetical protein
MLATPHGSVVPRKEIAESLQATCCSSKDEIMLLTFVGPQLSNISMMSISGCGQKNRYIRLCAASFQLEDTTIYIKVKNVFKDIDRKTCRKPNHP